MILIILLLPLEKYDQDMKIVTDIQFTKELLKEIKKLFPQKTTLSSIHLFYKNQIPLSGFFLEKGKVILKKNRNKSIEVAPYSFFGLSECLNNNPSVFEAQALKDSTIYFLDKTTLMEVLQTTQNSPLKNYIEKIIGSH